MFCKGVFKRGDKCLVHFYRMPESHDNWGQMWPPEDKEPPEGNFYLLNRLPQEASRRLPLLIHFNCCSSCTAGYDTLLIKTIVKLSLVPQIIKIDTFTSNYTKIFPFFQIKIL